MTNVFSFFFFLLNKIISPPPFFGTDTKLYIFIHISYSLGDVSNPIFIHTLHIATPSGSYSCPLVGTRRHVTNQRWQRNQPTNQRWQRNQSTDKRRPEKKEKKCPSRFLGKDKRPVDYRFDRLVEGEIRVSLLTRGVISRRPSGRIF